jgi:glycosyltransferase involved in cell wall biosynthesis
MRVGFDVGAMQAPQTGVGTYTDNLLQELRSFSQDEIVPIARPTVPWQVPGSNGRRTLTVNNTVWLQALLPWHLSRIGAEVCHFTNNVASLWTPCPAIVTIHDTTLWLFPTYHPRRRLLAMRPFIPLGARRARAIIAVSANTKRDLVRTLKVPDEKVHVIHEAPAPHFQPVPRTTALDAVRRAYDLPNSFILCVGTIEPRKNLIRLLKAFETLRRCGYASHALVLAGSRGWGDAAVRSSVERLGLGGAVHLLGYVPTHALVALYNLADALAFPSLYEGFGLPIVEAMACGTPVVTSPNGSLAEIADGAAEFVDPTNVESIVAGLRRVLADSQRRAELQSAGLARAAQFSWQRAAAQTRDVYASVLGL